MTKTDAASHFRLYLAEGFFDARECVEIIEELRGARAGAAAVYGAAGESGAVDERVRKAARLAPTRETLGRVVRRLSECRDAVASHFGVSLSRCEEPQFLRYRVGDFFVAHQDGNTGMLRSEREQSRKVSLVIFLNGQSEAATDETYGGGSLVFSDWRAGRKFALAGRAGALIAFPAETTHEVLPVTRGERFSIVSWFG